MRLVFAIFVSAVLAAAAAVVTNVFTEGWPWPWGVALGVLVVAQGLSQVWLRFMDRQRPEAAGSVSGPVEDSTIVTGNRSVGSVEGGTVVTGDDNVVGERGTDRT